MSEFLLGIDFGSNSARALLIDADSGTEYGSAFKNIHFFIFLHLIFSYVYSMLYH